MDDTRERLFNQWEIFKYRIDDLKVYVQNPGKTPQEDLDEFKRLYKILQTDLDTLYQDTAKHLEEGT